MSKPSPLAVTSNPDANVLLMDEPRRAPGRHVARSAGAVNQDRRPLPVVRKGAVLRSGPREPEEDQQSAGHSHHVVITEPTDTLAQLRPWDRRDLVDHQATLAT
jgi:hypothetical protein